MYATYMSEPVENMMSSSHVSRSLYKAFIETLRWELAKKIAGWTPPWGVVAANIAAFDGWLEMGNFEFPKLVSGDRCVVHTEPKLSRCFRVGVFGA